MGSKVSFTAMEHGTQEDCDIVNEHFDAHIEKFADQVLDWLRQLDGDSPYQVSRLEHCLQTATRAENDGADEETVVCALLHDIGDILAPANHSQVAAALLAPSTENPTAYGFNGGVLWQDTAPTHVAVP